MSAQNWSHFRGNNLDGKALDSNVPVHWSADSNLVWKSEIPGSGWSSPVVWEKQIWLTSAEDEGKELYALCYDRASGELVHKILVFTPDTVYGKHSVNTYATPTPAIEHGKVYIHFGSYGTSCIDTETGKTIWKRTDLNCDHVQGPGASPLIYKNMLILHLEGSDIMYLVALNKETGETLWKTHRPAEIYDNLEPIGKKAYITPIVIDVNGQELLISNGSAVCIAYDVSTGEEVWRVIQGEDSTISMPITEKGMVYFYTSFVTPEDGQKYCELVAVDPNGKGDITNSHVKWRLKAPILQLLTPVIHNGLIYTIDTKSQLMIIEAENGAVLDQQRVHGKFNASPIVANGLVYFPSNTGKTLVIKEGRQIEIVAENQLEGQIWATPAVSNDQFLIRTSRFLYLIGLD